MNDFKVDKYLGEVLQQIEFTQIARGYYVKALSNKSTTEAFFAAQAFLGAVAMISKILWPASDVQESVKRGERLRNILLDADKNYLIQSRKVRNGFEHFDERLDNYLQAHTVIVDHVVGPMGSVKTNAPAYMRHIDNTNHTVAVLGESTNLNEITRELQMIHDRAYEWKSAHGPRMSRDSI